MKHTPGRLRVVWGKPDMEELQAQLDRHAEDAIALTKQIHPATVSKQPTLDVSVEEILASGNQPCPVFDLFTRERIR